MSCGYTRGPAFHPFFADAFVFDPLSRMAPMGGAPWWRHRKLKAHCSGRRFESQIVIDMVETEDSIQIQADIPGATKDTVQIEVEKAVLAISVTTPAAPTRADPSAPPQPPANNVDPADVAGPSTAPAPALQEPPASTSPADEDAADPAEKDAEAEVLVQERPRTYARRIVEIQEGTDAFKAEASCADGVLTITIPKDGASDSKTRVPIA